MIDGRLNPDSVTAFCTGDYKVCPSWRAEVEARNSNKRGVQQVVAERRAIGQREAMVKRARQAVRSFLGGNPKERAWKAAELLTGDSPEAKRFRHRLGLDT